MIGFAFLALFAIRTNANELAVRLVEVLVEDGEGYVGKRMGSTTPWGGRQKPA